MKLFLSRPRSGIDAIAEYNIDKKEFVVLKGSKVSNSVSCAEKFRGAKSVVEKREGVISADNRTVIDVVFKSPSTAANFVTGISTNGCLAWRDANGNKLKDIISKNKEVD